jgi:hypothetical protein
MGFWFCFFIFIFIVHKALTMQWAHAIVPPEIGCPGEALEIEY